MCDTLGAILVDRLSQDLKDKPCPELVSFFFLHVSFALISFFIDCLIFMHSFCFWLIGWTTRATRIETSHQRKGINLFCTYLFSAIDIISSFIIQRVWVICLIHSNCYFHSNFLFDFFFCYSTKSFDSTAHSVLIFFVLVQAGCHDTSIYKKKKNS